MARRYCGNPVAASRSGATICRTALGASVALMVARMAQWWLPPCTSTQASSPAAFIGIAAVGWNTSAALDNCTGACERPPRRSME
jgi:hypothetical protein